MKNFAETVLDSLSEENIKQNIFQTYDNINLNEIEEFVLYGLPKEAFKFYNECVIINLKISDVFDDFKSGYFEQIKIKKDIDLKTYEDTWIVICTHRFGAVYEKLKKKGFKKLIPLWALQILYPRKFRPHENYKGWIKEIINNKSDYYLTENLFQDEKSIFTWQNYINFKITFDPIYICNAAKIMTDSHELDAGRDTFPEDINLPIDSNEIFIDGGAWNGDTIEKFLLYNKRYKTVYGYEPSKKLYDIINKKFSSNDKIKVFNSGLSNVNKTQYFDDREDTSSLFVSKKSNSTKSVDVEKIDNLGLTEQNVTIKLNVEGYENKALKGAKKTIDNNNVNFVICLNHNNKDLTELPLTIYKFKKSLHFFLRIVDYGINGLVLYVKRL